MIDKVQGIEVIKREDLKAGDYLLVRCSREYLKQVADWATWFFRNSGCKVGVITEDMNVEIIREPE